MQEALQNPHYKKIWEKINWQIRHPEEENLNLALGSEYLQYQKECITITSQDGVIKEVLGRPITLEDILILISQKAYSISIPCYASVIIVTILRNGVVTESILDWELDKPLHEQTPETWEKISNLI